jgi:hypothetical protein
MEVVTLVGGFRGLGAITTREQNDLLTWLQTALRDADNVAARIRQATGTGQIPLEAGHQLDNFYQTITDRAVALINQVGTLESAEIGTWRVQARALLGDAAAFVAEGRLVLGDLQNRGLKLALLAAGSVALFGGAAWVIYRYGRRRRR